MTTDPELEAPIADTPRWTISNRCLQRLGEKNPVLATALGMAQARIEELEAALRDVLILRDKEHTDDQS